MKTETNKQLFRLAAVLYADNNYEVNSKTIHKKIVESVFLDNGNKESTVDEIIDWIQEKYNLIFTEEEIKNIVSDERSFSFTTKKNLLYLRLTENRLSVLQNKVQKSNVDYFIKVFIDKKSEYKSFDVKGIIYKFLYEVFSTNIASFNKLLDYKKDIRELKTIESGKFNDIEKEIVNSFLQWENDGKNKAIFDISSYALEYCLITNNASHHHIQLDNLCGTKPFI